MSFALYPPELNSALMYTGPGSGPMASAAASWDGLAAELYAAAESYQSVVTGLTAGWRGPSSMMMLSAAQPYVAWMNTTASLAEQAGAQAKAAIAAFETAHAATAPPAEVEANRVTLAALEATNFFGQNSTAIALTEEQYLQMWIQDALAMDTYSVASSHTSALTPFDTPTTTANPMMATAASIPASVTSATSSVVAWLQQLQTTLTSVLGSLTGWAASVPLLAEWEAALAVYNPTAIVTPAGFSAAIGSPLTSTATQLGYYTGRYAMYTTMFTSMTSSGSNTAGAASGLDMGALSKGIESLVSTKLAPISQTLSEHFASMNQAVLANVGHAQSISGLSVPQGWGHAAAPVMDRAVPMLPQTSVAAPAVNAGTPAMSGPFVQGLMGALSGRGVAGLTAKVGGKVIPRAPVGG